MRQLVVPYGVVDDSEERGEAESSTVLAPGRLVGMRR